MPYLPRKLLQPIRGRLAGYAAGVGLFLVSLSVRLAADNWLPPGFPFLTFFPGVILATLLAGRGPGIVCALLSGLAALYYFVPPFHSFDLSGGRVTAMLFYLFVVAIDIVLIDGLVHRQRQLEASEARLTQLTQMQTLLFKELQHRVANNLATVASMLRLQRRQIAANPPSALDAIDRANERIELMGEVHRQLYDPNALDLPLAQQIRRAVDHARGVWTAGDVQVQVDVADARLEIGRLMTLVLLISELLGNSFKHAFDGHPAPAVRVVIERIGDNRLRLTVADNGRGLPAPAEQAPVRRGLGTAIIQGFVAQLGGTMRVENVGGVTSLVEFAEG
ncbi:sensor histidine kinase [Novosphingobium sp.]|uniref:sensor histidine kinase n=1 Tax=Novosphingobium sp. TaxID=1874826 RepID=UPI0038B6E564